MTDNQLSILDVIENGIAKSAAHAELEEPGWGNKALEYFRLYATLHPSFLTEDVRSFAYADGLQEPPAVGAWGSVSRRAVKEGYVKSRGKTPSNNPSQHGKYMTLWVSEIFQPGTSYVSTQGA